VLLQRTNDNHALVFPKAPRQMRDHCTAGVVPKKKRRVVAPSACPPFPQVRRCVGPAKARANTTTTRNVSYPGFCNTTTVPTAAARTLIWQKHSSYQSGRRPNMSRPRVPRYPDRYRRHDRSSVQQSVRMVMLTRSFVLVDSLETIENPTHIFWAAAGPVGHNFLSVHIFFSSI
jgi:hypothetical protein